MEEESGNVNKNVEDLRVERLNMAKEIKKESDENMEELPIEEENEDGEMQVSSRSNESESSGEDEDDSQVDYPRSPVLELKFTPKEKRGTIKTEEQLQQEEEVEENRKKNETEERKQRTIESLKHQVDTKEEKEVDEFSSSEEDDEETIQKEFALWKVRELKRLQREFQRSEDIRKEKEDKERRQLLADDEITKENEKNGRGEKNRTQYKFLQKVLPQRCFLS